MDPSLLLLSSHLFLCLFQQGKGDGIYSASASLFHMSHLKRDLDIVQFIKTTANICGSNKVKQ